MSPATLEQARSAVLARLHDRRSEIERAILTRVYAVSDPGEIADSEYTDGLRAAVSAAIDYGLIVIERGGDRSTSVPAALLAQARLAARNGVSLDTVLRRYFAGYTLLGDFLVEEAGAVETLEAEALQPLLRAQAPPFDRVIAAISEEHAREADRSPDSSERRRAELVHRLLVGERIDMAGLRYDFDAWHVGAIAVGSEAAEAIQGLAAALDRRLLIVRPEEGLAWAWFGGWRRVTTDTIAEHAVAEWSADARLAIGEPARGLTGWRLTHSQAKAVLPVAQRNAESVVRYADAGLLAAALQDDVLVSSLRQLFLAPLAEERDGGAAARQTLRAYFVADRNVSSAAAALGLSRQTVTSRIRSIEEKIGRPLSSCALEMEIALRLETSAEIGQIAERRLST